MVELRRNIGYAIQGSVLLPHLTVEENIAFVLNLLNKQDKAGRKEMDEHRRAGGKYAFPEILLKEIHQKSGITVLFVTHDIDEALSLGTKVLIMSVGKIEQFAAPEELFKNPATEFVRNLVAN